MDSSTITSRVPLDDELGRIALLVADDLPECQHFLGQHLAEAQRDPGDVASRLCELFLDQALHLATGRGVTPHFKYQESTS